MLNAPPPNERRTEKMTKSKLMKYPKEYLFELLCDNNVINYTYGWVTKKDLVNDFQKELSELVEEDESYI